MFSSVSRDSNSCLIKFFCELGNVCLVLFTVSGTQEAFSKWELLKMTALAFLELMGGKEKKKKKKK